MHGEIKLKRWLPFTAEQVIRSDSQMMWKATVRRNGIPIRGFDRLVGGEGAMQIPLSIVRNFPAVLSVRMAVINANGKAYIVDKIYRLTQ